jgi:hypothetical protein
MLIFITVAEKRKGCGKEKNPESTSKTQERNQRLFAPQHRSAGCASFGHHLSDNRRGARRIPLEVSGFETRDRFHEAF